MIDVHRGNKSTYCKIHPIIEVVVAVVLVVLVDIDIVVDDVDVDRGFASSFDSSVFHQSGGSSDPIRTSVMKIVAGDVTNFQTAVVVVVVVIGNDGGGGWS